jgi:hypothetical protein
MSLWTCFYSFLCWFTTLFLWCFYWFFSYCSLEISLLFLMIALVLFLELVFRHASKGDSSTSFLNQILHLTNPHDKLSTFVLYPSHGFPSIYRLTLWDSRLGHLSLSPVIYRKEDSEWRTWALMISVFCLEWLRYGWFSIFLFMDFDFPYCSVTSSLTLWAFSYTLLILAWNVKLLLCSLDLIACIIIALSCILLLVQLDLFATCGVHWSDYSCFLCGLICSPLCLTMLWLWPMLFHHGVRLQYRCDF